MIAFIRGELAEIKEYTVVLDQNGIGYELFVPQTCFGMLPPLGGEVKLHTYLQVKEDGVALFGFPTKEELHIFKLLITVNGIGPKGAIAILSTLRSDELRLAVLSGDAKSICNCPGIGKKTAEKLILELRDKFSPEDIFDDMADRIVSSNKQVAQEAREEALQALQALGYSGTDCLRAIKRVAITEQMTTEQLLREALRVIGG